MSRKHINATIDVQNHLTKLEKSSNLESLCTRCGDCCLASIDMNGTVIVVPELPCRFLAVKGNGKFTCSVYKDRFKKAPWCRDLLSGMLSGAYPKTCVYTKGMSGYNGGVKLPPSVYKKLKSDLQHVAKSGDRKKLLATFHVEDLIRFFGEEQSWMSKSLPSAETYTDSSDWLGTNFYFLHKNVHWHLARKLDRFVAEREYFKSIGSSTLIKSYVDRQVEDCNNGLSEVVDKLCTMAGIKPSTDLSKAVNTVYAYKLITQKPGRILEPRILNYWLLEKAISKKALTIQKEAWWHIDNTVEPTSIESFILGKSLELVGLAKLGKFNLNTLIQDLLLFTAITAKSPL